MITRIRNKKRSKL